jgi:MoaA/NifB/PqqE/SkfB family radical SAM enzyme
VAQSGASAAFDVRESLASSLTSASPNGQLESVDVYITSQCNRRCTYCFLPTEFFASGARMSMDRFAGVVSWSRRHDLREITLLGGEPSLHRSFAAMVSHAAAQGLKVRVVTNGARQFRRLLADTTIGKHNLSRVAVSLDTLDQTVQDRFRGPEAWQEAMDTIGLLRKHEVPFDINVTAVRPVLRGLDDLIAFAEHEGCRRVNIHWPSTMGIGSGLSADQMPGQNEWEALVRRIGSRVETQPGFFVEIERGFLAEGEPLTGCALVGFSNLEIMPDGRAYRCGLLVDQPAMASLTMTEDELRLSRPDYGEELLLSTMPPSCDGCPVMRADGRRACIFDKVSSLSLG